MRAPKTLGLCGKAAPLLVLLATASMFFCAGSSAATATSIAGAARAGKLAEVRELLRTGGDANAPESDGTTALLWAAFQSNIDMTKALLAAGANANAANNYGVTPLLQASRNGDAAMMQVLLDGGADPKITHPKGETPLMAAARTGRTDAVKALLDHGADVNAADSYQNQTALMWAAAEGQVEVVDQLLKAGADPNKQARVSAITERSINADFPTGGFTALMWAARDGDEKVARSLIKGGADPKLMNGDQATATMIAIVNDRFDLAATLLDLGASVDDGSLYYAVAMRDATTDQFAHDGSRLRADHPNTRTALDLVKLLLDKGADPNRAFVGQVHSYGMHADAQENASPFYRAAVAADVETLKMFVAHGASIEWTPSKVDGAKAGVNANVGKTPLVVAMSGGKGVGRTGGPGDLRQGPPPFREPSNREPVAAVRVLLEAGANPNTVLPDGNTAVHEAIRIRQPEVIRVLAAAGAKLDQPNKDGVTPLKLAENPPKPKLNPGAPPPEEAKASEDDVLVALREVMAGNRSGAR